MSSAARDTVILIPLKALHVAKSRLRGTFGDEGAEELVRSLASRVIAAADPRRRLVVCDDDATAAFAEQAGAEVFFSPELTLNGAVADAYRQMGTEADQVIIAHADLLEPVGLGSAHFDNGVTLVLDHLGTGTNVLVLPTGLDFRFAFGPNSASRHESEARRLKLAICVIDDSPWRFDVDEPEDLSGSLYSI